MSQDFTKRGLFSAILDAGIAGAVPALPKDESFQKVTLHPRKADQDARFLSVNVYGRICVSDDAGVNWKTVYGRTENPLQYKGKMG